MNLRNSGLYISILFFSVLTFLSLQIPFFWDGTFFSEIALNIFNKGFSHIIDINQPDTGGFPLYSIYMAGAWKLLGKSLSVSHIAILPFLVGICLEYFKLANRFLHSSSIPLAILLLITEPVLSTQSILMGYDLFMVYFFLLSLNALLQNRNKLFGFALVLLCLSNMRGIFAAIALLLIAIFVLEQKTLKQIFKFFPALITLLCWAFLHHYKTGWYLFSPERESTHEAVLPLHSALRQFLFIIWKLMDAGHAFLFFFAVIFIILHRKFFRSHPLIKILFVCAISLIACMSVLANPIGPKYFIIILLLLNLVCCLFLENIDSIKKRTFISILFVGSLISGNFWMYPERLGNSWDSTLKILPYFQLKDQMDDYITDNKIPPSQVGTQYPLIADKRISHLNETPFSYTNVWSGPVENYKYFLQTNVINTDIPEQIKRVKEEWTLLKQYQRGQVYISLYKNPGL